MKHSVASVCLAAALIAPAAADELKVIAGGSLGGAFAELAPRFEQASGHKLTIAYGATPQLINKATSGETFDVAVVPREVFADAAAKARFVPAPTVTIGRAGYGVAVRAGSARPDIGTPDALKAAMLKAQSVTFIPNGAAGAYVMNVFDRLGIGEAMRAKTKAQPNTAGVTNAIKYGDAEFDVFLVNVFAVPGSRSSVRSPATCRTT
jgi:molybdate transport system substrate-binding protein